MNQAESASATLGCGLAGEVVRTFGHLRLRVFGTSMVPSILPGDLISIERAEVSEISYGDVVLYSRGGRMFAHRVMAHAGSSDEPLLITRGDRLCYNDPPISSTELLGRVTSIERAHGHGFRPVQPARPSRWERVMVRALQMSDLATNFYVRLIAFWPSLFSRRAACRA